MRDIAGALASHDKHKQIQFAFHVFDTNRDGILDRSELMNVLQYSKGKEFSRKIPTEELDTIVDALFASAAAGRHAHAGVEKEGLDFEEFQALLLHRTAVNMQ